VGLVQGPGGVELSGREAAARRRVLVARHGQTDWNRDGRFQGHGDPPLNARGRAEAAALAAELAGEGVTYLATSDLVRARQTAAVIAERTGLEANPCPAFREVDLGTWEGLTEREVARRHPDELRAWQAGRDVRRGGGETETEAVRRFVGGLDRVLAATGEEGTPLIVAHGLVLRRVLDHLVATGRMDLPGPAPHLANGRWSSLQVRPQPPTL
jgi:broad specificity phosphatase PhoE